MAGRKVGGRATQPSQKEIEEMIKKFNRSRDIIETRLGNYQFQRNDICYANNVAPSRADIPVLKNAPAQGPEWTLKDWSDNFQISAEMKAKMTGIKIANIYSTISKALNQTFNLAHRKVEQAQSLNTLIQELEQATFKVKSITHLEYRGSVLRVMNSMDAIIIDIKHFYERVEFVLIDFDRKSGTKLAAAEAELNKIMSSGLSRLQMKMDAILNTIKLWAKKGPTIEKMVANVQKVGALAKTFHIPLIGALFASWEFVDAVNTFAKDPTDENMNKMYTKLINYVVELVIELVMIVVALFSSLVAIVLTLILVIIGIIDLVTGHDTIAESIYSAWNKRMETINYITEKLKSAKNSVLTFVDDADRLFSETYKDIMATGG